MTLDQLSAAATEEAEELWEKCCLADLYYKPFGEPDFMQTSVGIIANALNQARAGQLAAVADDAVERYRHVKRGTVYEVVGEAELQMNADNLVDGSQMMVYRGEDGRLWCRHYDEFHDGRFAAMKDTQP